MTCHYSLDTTPNASTISLVSGGEVNAVKSLMRKVITMTNEVYKAGFARGQALNGMTPIKYNYPPTLSQSLFFVVWRKT